jgi:hypothetical protein
LRGTTALPDGKLLAIVKMEHFHEYLCGQEFHLHIDHSTLTSLLSFKNLEGQMACLVHCPQEYNFTSENHQGQKNMDANELCRRPCLGAYPHGQKVVQQAGSLEVWAISAAVMDGWDHAILRRE